MHSSLTLYTFNIIIENRPFWGLEVPPLRQAENWNFSKGFVIRKKRFFAGRQNLIFQHFAGGQKTSIFNYKNDRFWAFFDRNPKMLDLDTKMCDSSTFLKQWCPKNKAKQRFEAQNVRQFYDFATLMSGKQSKTTISRPKCATVLRFCNTDVWKTL